jgi:membrane-bound ClpP family serine protease
MAATPVGTATSVQRVHRFSPGQVLGGAVGVVLVIFGIIAVTRTGIDSHLNTPVTNIMGMNQSAWVGIAELAVGLLLILSAADIAFRGVMGALGVLLVIGGVVVAAADLKMLLDIGTEHATGWFAIIMGAIALLGAMLPSFTRSTRTTTAE